MSQLTRQEIIDAYSALDDLRDNALEWEGVKAQKQYHAVLKILPPIPQPTMAEVEWDDDEHHLVEAEHDSLGKVVMLHPAPDTRIRCLRKWYGPYRVYSLIPAHLTPTGKRYELKEIQE